MVIVWILLNMGAFVWQWDPYPPVHPAQPRVLHPGRVRAPPLILLAQNRQENRDRVSLEEDRRRAEQTKADTEYLARELAALRLAVGEVATRDYLRRELEEIREMIADLHRPSGDGDVGSSKHATERRSKKKNS